MSECPRVRPLLSLSAGGDLPPGVSERVRRHVATCAECRDEESGFLWIMEAARSVSHPEYQLAESVKMRLALEAADCVARRSWYPLPFIPFRERTGLVASAAAILLALVALPIAIGQRWTSSRQEPPMQIDVVAASGSVHLAWSDGEKDTYTVYKSSDPRTLDQAEAHVVRGTVWTDSDPGSAPVVFYRIEPGGGT